MALRRVAGPDNSCARGLHMCSVHVHVRPDDMSGPRFAHEHRCSAAAPSPSAQQQGGALVDDLGDDGLRARRAGLHSSRPARASACVMTPTQDSSTAPAQPPSMPSCSLSQRHTHHICSWSVFQVGVTSACSATVCTLVRAHRRNIAEASEFSIAATDVQDAVTMRILKRGAPRHWTTEWGPHRPL